MMCGQKIGRMIPISFGNILLPSAAFFVCFPVSQCAWSLWWDSTLHDGKIPSIFLCAFFSTDNSMMDAISYYAAKLRYTMLVPFYVKRKGFRQRALKFFLSWSSFWSHVCPFCEALASLGWKAENRDLLSYIFRHELAKEKSGYVRLSASSVVSKLISLKIIFASVLYFFLICDVACNLVIDDWITEDMSLDDCWLRVKVMSNKAIFIVRAYPRERSQNRHFFQSLYWLAGWLAQVAERMTMDVLDVEINIQLSLQICSLKWDKEVSAPQMSFETMRSTFQKNEWMTIVQVRCDASDLSRVDLQTTKSCVSLKLHLSLLSTGEYIKNLWKEWI